MAVPPFFMEPWRGSRYYWCTANNSPAHKCSICRALAVACLLIVVAAVIGFVELIKHG